MFPSGSLVDLEARKRVLQARIAVHRLECVEAAAGLARPLDIVDRTVATWRRIAPFLKLLAIPGGLFFAHLLKKKRTGPTGRAQRGKLATIVAMLPMVMKVAKFAMQFRAAQTARTRATAAR